MRLDDYLFIKSLIKDKEKIPGIILSGNVLVNDKSVFSSAYRVKEDDLVRIKEMKKWVSRSAEKLDTFIEKQKISVFEKVCLDIGSSTGGFTEVLLNRGAKLVYAVDVGYGLIHPKLRSHEKVVVYERTHICQFEIRHGMEIPLFFTMDVSFISIQKVLLCLKEKFKTFEGVALFKPQFEVETSGLINGILHDKDIMAETLLEFSGFLKENYIEELAFLPATIKGTKGNQEYCYHLRWDSNN